MQAGDRRVLDPQTVELLERGSALIVGTVDADGEPHAGRGWGLDVLDAGMPARVRLLVDVDDHRTIDAAAAGGAMAITATCVRTLRSTQLKGRALGLDAPATTDLPRMERYLRAFFGDIIDTDGTDPALLEAFRPAGAVPCIVEVHERFDQTPGPAAGARVGGGA